VITESTVDPSPFVQFTRWFQDAHALYAQGLDPTAMTLATASAVGVPTARMVLLKSFDERGFVFYSHYDSAKGRDLAENPRAALVFYWAPLERQVRLVGEVTRVSRDESQAYFDSRPREARLGAWASRQSTVLPDRAALEARLAEATARFPSDDIPLPPYWGGFRLAPASVEFWQARPGRLHDRLRYTRQPDGAWRIERLAP
jgi:pyridoxamine 5'-phosphate oxidase